MAVSKGMARHCGWHLISRTTKGAPDCQFLGQLQEVGVGVLRLPCCLSRPYYLSPGLRVLFLPPAGHVTLGRLFNLRLFSNK